MLEQLLIFGSYPEILSQQGIGAKAQYLGELRDAYLYKDILELENLRNSRKLLDLLTLLAFQIGQGVSLTEIGASLGLSKRTVARSLSRCPLCDDYTREFFGVLGAGAGVATKLRPLTLASP
jgi:predicted AAA+ superfamily ATPase